MKLGRESAIQTIKMTSFLILVFFFGMAVGIPAYAQDAPAWQGSEIIFVLDCSQSMQDADNGYAVHEFIREFTASAPYGCKVGLVTYHNEVAVSLPAGSSYSEIADALSQLEYRYYGNAGAGMQEAVGLLKNGQNHKKIILISDGEIVMKTQGQTEESVKAYKDAVSAARRAGIEIDILSLGVPIEEGETIYYAAQDTGGDCYKLEDGNALQDFIYRYMHHELGMPGRLVGKISGTGGELKVKLPDCMMEEARIILTGRQQNDNLTVNCDAGGIDILKGSHYTAITLQQPHSEEVAIQMSSEGKMDVTAYFIARYEVSISASSTYDSGLQQGEIYIRLEGQDGRNLLEGHLADGGVSVLLDGKSSPCEVDNGMLTVSKKIMQSEEVSLEVLLEDGFGSYSGTMAVAERIEVPEIEEPAQQTDWFFWGVMLAFLAALVLIFMASVFCQALFPKKSV